jgi:hypothetical protein
MPLKTSDEKQDLTLKVFDYFEAESKLSLGESEMNISCMLEFWGAFNIVAARLSYVEKSY